MIPLISIALAAASSESGKSLSEELWERFEVEFPEPLLEETLGLTSQVQEVLGVYYTDKAILMIAKKNDVKRFKDWLECYSFATGDALFEIAESNNSTHEIIRAISESKFFGPVLYVAKNKNTPLDILKKLAMDPRDKIRIAARRTLCEFVVVP